MTQKPTFQNEVHVSHRPAFRLSAGVCGAFLKHGGFPASIVTVLAPLWGKEDINAYAVMHDFPIREYLLVLRFLLGHAIWD